MNAKDASPLDLLAEDCISLADVTSELPSDPNKSTAWRWAKRGLKGVKLEVVQIGGKAFTSRQALTRFIARTQG